MPGRSAAPSRTVERITANCASLVIVSAALATPRIMLLLTPHAHRRSASIDCMGGHELCPAAVTCLAAATVDIELVDKRPALATRIAIITEAGAARIDR